MSVAELFTDKKITEKIQARLPELFYLAELESSRAGKIGMEVGSAREKVLIALLIYKFGEANVETHIPITEPEVDVKIFNDPLSIKTITGKKLNGVKVIWTVDAEQALTFSKTYLPSCDTLLVQINWDAVGWFFLFPKEIQLEVLKDIGRERYIKLPKAGTNPRGVEISGEALEVLGGHKKCSKFPIKWVRKEIEYNPYERWLDLWQKD